MRSKVSVTAMGWLLAYLKVVIKLDCPIRLPIVVEPLKLNDKGLGEFANAHPFDGVPFLLTLLAEICIVTLQQLPFDKLVQGLLKVARLDRQVESHERLFPFVSVGASLANFLIRKNSLELFRKDLGLVDAVQEFVNLFKDRSDH